MSVLSAANFRALWLPSLSGTGEDTALGTLLARVEARIARYLGYPPASGGGTPTIEDTTYTRYYGRDDIEEQHQVLRLDVLPVVSITSIHDDLDREYGDADLVAATDYSIADGDRGLVILDIDSSHGFWRSGFRNIKAVYVAGFATVPEDLVQAHGDLALYWWQSRRTQGFTTVPQGAGSASVATPDADIPATVQDLLQPYRLPSVYL